MSEVEIKNTLREFITTNFMVATEFADADSFLQHGIVDSLGILDLMSFVEKTWGFKPAAKDMIPDNFDSLDRLAGYIQRNAETSNS